MKLGHDALFRWRWAVLAPLALFYVVCLPQTVQALDTGELVASGVRLWVPHPPGYPLYVWALHGFLGALPWGTAFFRAALLTSAYTLGGLALLLALAESWFGVVCVALLGTVPVVARYAVLPDVFALHLLLTSAVLYCVLAPRVRHRELLTCCAFGLGAANHQSIVFLAPAVVFVLYESRSLRQALPAMAIGALISVGLYLSLLAFDVESPSSWGIIRTVPDVVAHFLRRDFGTFTLFPNVSEANAPSSAFAPMFFEVWTVIAVASIAIVTHFVARGTSWRVGRDNQAWLIVLVCLALYVLLFVSLMNFPDGPRWSATRERFFIFPAVLMTAIAVRAARPPLPRPWAVALVGSVGLCAVLNALRDAPLRELAHDTVIEDWARNILSTASDGARPGFLIVDGDTELFAVRYVQAVEGEHDVVPIGIGMAFDAKLFAKIRASRPSFVVDADAVNTSKDHGFIKLLVEPNVDAYDFTTSLRVVAPRLRTVYYPCGRKLTSGSGIAFGEPREPLRLNVPDYDVSKANPDLAGMWGAYADYYLARARVARANGDRDAAIDDYKAGLAVVPWCWPCLQALCPLESEAGIDDPSCGQ